MPSIKVHGGTRNDAKSLCFTCQSATAMLGSADSQQYVHCGYIGRQVRMTVSECNRYTQAGTTSLGDMYDIAWVLETSKNNRTIGFVSATEWRAKHGPSNGVPR